MVIDAPVVAKTGFAAFQGGGQSLRGKNKGYVHSAQAMVLIFC